MGRNRDSVGGATRRLTLALMVMLLGLVAPAVATAADASPTIGGFSARALGPDDEVTPDTYFKVQLKAGDTFSGRLLVISSAKEDARLKFYSVDGLTGKTSGTVYSNIDDPRKGASRWITPRKEILRLPAKGEKKVGFDVKVPEDAIPGDHVGGLALQLADQKKTTGQFAVTQVIRVAIAVQIVVEGPAAPAMNLTSMKLEALSGTQIPSVTVGMANTGQLLCRPQLTVSLAEDGAVIGTVTRRLDTVLPRQSIPYPLQWPKPLQPGTYQATAVTEGCGDRAELKADLKLASSLRGSSRAPGPLELPDEGGTPWWVFLLGGLGVAAAFGGGFFLARRQPKEKGSPDAPAQV